MSQYGSVLSIMREICATFCAPLSGISGSCSVGLHAGSRHVWITNQLHDMFYIHTAGLMSVLLRLLSVGDRLPAINVQVSSSQCFQLWNQDAVLRTEVTVYCKKNCTKQNFYLKSRCPPGTLSREDASLYGNTSPPPA